MSVIDGSLSCSGTITATFTWQSDPNDPTDTPPSAVVIAETATAQWDSSYDVAATPTGSSDNGLGFEEVPTSYGYGSYGYKVGLSTGTRYKIKENPSDEFSITCSPNVQVTGEGVAGPPIKGGNAYGSLKYKATAQPLEIVLSGGIGPKDNKRFLIGQKVTASLFTGGLSPSVFDWSVLGGEPFKNYTANEDEAVLSALGIENTNPLVFYYRKPIPDQGVSTVTCTTHLMVPSGALPANGLNVTLSRQSRVDAPSSSLTAGMGTVQGDPVGDPTSMKLDGATRSNIPVADVGVFWEGTVTTPVAYGTGGGWNFTQTEMTNRVIQSPGTIHERSMNGYIALDNDFGYMPVMPELYTDDGSTNVAWDSPSQGFWSPMTHVEVDDDFTVYMLYRPPGQDSVFVPLRSLRWFWGGEAAPNQSGDWQISNIHTDWYAGQNFPPHPIWDANIEDAVYIPALPAP